MEQEPRAANQVPLLLSMQEDELALQKAIESGDTDLVYLAMFHLKRKCSLAEFFRLINNKPIACSLLEQYARSNDLQLLKDFYYQDDRRASSAKLLLIEAFHCKELSEYIEKLKAANKLFAQDKQCVFEAKVSLY